MNHEFRIGGILISTVVPAFVIALIATVLLSLILTRINFYRLVWQRPLVDLCLLIIIFGILVVLLPDGWPIS